MSIAEESAGTGVHRRGARCTVLAEASGQFMAVARFAELRARVSGVLRDRLEVKVELISLAANMAAARKRSMLQGDVVDADYALIPALAVMTPNPVD